MYFFAKFNSKSKMQHNLNATPGYPLRRALNIREPPNSRSVRGPRDQMLYRLLRYFIFASPTLLSPPRLCTDLCGLFVFQGTSALGVVASISSLRRLLPPLSDLSDPSLPACQLLSCGSCGMRLADLACLCARSDVREPSRARVKDVASSGNDSAGHERQEQLVGRRMPDVVPDSSGVNY